ncbi:MAG: hypothetical protein ACR2ID_07775 [Chthoniobacterales bacterium]
MHRTTIRLDEHLLIRVKEYAVQRRISLTAVIEEALRTHLSPRMPLPVSKVSLPTFKGSGFAPGIETWEDVQRVLEDEEIENLKRIERENAKSRR